MQYFSYSVLINFEILCSYKSMAERNWIESSNVNVGVGDFWQNLNSKQKYSSAGYYESPLPLIDRSSLHGSAMLQRTQPNHVLPIYSSANPGLLQPLVQSSAIYDGQPMFQPPTAVGNNPVYSTVQQMQPSGGLPLPAQNLVNWMVQPQSAFPAGTGGVSYQTGYALSSGQAVSRQPILQIPPPATYISSQPTSALSMQPTNTAGNYSFPLPSQQLVGTGPSYSTNLKSIPASINSQQLFGGTQPLPGQLGSSIQPVYRELPILTAGIPEHGLIQQAFNPAAFGTGTSVAGPAVWETVSVPGQTAIAGLNTRTSPVTTVIG